MNLRVGNGDRPKAGRTVRSLWNKPWKNTKRLNESRGRRERGEGKGLERYLGAEDERKVWTCLFQGPIRTVEWIHPVGSSMSPQCRRKLRAGDPHLTSGVG